MPLRVEPDNDGTGGGGSPGVDGDIIWYDTIAQQEADPGNPTPILAYNLETTAFYKWIPGSVASVNNWTTLSATGGSPGRWLIFSEKISIASIGGGVDDWPRLKSAMDGCAYRVSIYLRSGTWTCLTRQEIPDGTHIICEPGVIIRQTLPISGAHNNAAFTRDSISSPTGVTALASNVVIGSRTVIVTDATLFALEGTFSLTENPNRNQSFTIKNIVGTTITVDRPILYAYTTVGCQVVIYPQPRDIIIEGNGADINGTGDRYASIISGWRCKISGFRTTNAQASEYLYAFSDGSRECEMEGIDVDGCQSAAIAIEACEMVIIRNCTVQRCTNDPGILFQGTYATIAINIHARSGSFSGIQIGYTADTVGCTGLKFYGCTSYGNAIDGFQVVASSADTEFHGCEASYNGGAGFIAFAQATPTRTPARMRLFGGRAIGNNYGVEVSGVIGNTIDGLFTSNSITHGIFVHNAAELIGKGITCSENIVPTAAIGIYDTSRFNGTDIYIKSLKTAGINCFVQFSSAVCFLNRVTAENVTNLVGIGFANAGGILNLLDCKTVGCAYASYVGGAGSNANTRFEGRNDFALSSNQLVNDTLGQHNFGSIALVNGVATFGWRLTRADDLTPEVNRKNFGAGAMGGTLFVTKNPGVGIIITSVALATGATVVTDDSTVEVFIP